jgi:CBS domain-containing protein
MKRPLTAKDVMLRPKFIKELDSVNKVKKLLRTTEDTLIVKNKKGKFVGEIHEIDLLPLLIPERNVSEEQVIGILGLDIKRAFFPKNARDLMTSHDITVTPGVSVGKIAEIMNKEDIKAVPVIKGKTIVGVVHLRNILKKIKRKW